METEAWNRICSHAGSQFKTKTSRRFTYSAPGNFVRVTRDGVDTDRSLPRTNFVKGCGTCPRTDLDISRIDKAYTWAILMDERIRREL